VLHDTKASDDFRRGGVSLERFRKSSLDTIPRVLAADVSTLIVVTILSLFRPDRFKHQRDLAANILDLIDDLAEDVVKEFCVLPPHDHRRYWYAVPELRRRRVRIWPSLARPATKIEDDIEGRAFNADAIDVQRRLRTSHGSRNCLSEGGGVPASEPRATL